MSTDDVNFQENLIFHEPDHQEIKPKNKPTNAKKKKLI